MKKIALFICLAVFLATANPIFAGRHHHVAHARSHHAHQNHHSGHGAGWHNNWHSGWHDHHHHHHGHSIFIGSFGYPYWGYPYYAGYPYFYASFPIPIPYAYSGYGYNNHPAYPYNSHVAPGYSNGYNSGSAYNNNVNHPAGGGDSDVARVQSQLAKEGYYQGEIDGNKGSRTYYAIRSYQRAHGLRTTGEIDNELLNAMRLR